MDNLRCTLCAFALLTSSTGPAVAAVTAYTDEAQYLADVAVLGVTVVHEGFEEDAAWGHVRGTTAPSVTNLGITWTADNPNSGVTTGSGPALTGDYGFYTLPHGDFANGIGDGFVGTSDQLLYAVGGWIETNTPPAGISLVLDADSSPVNVDFGEECDPGGENCVDLAILGTAHKFFGAISTDGFHRFDFLETEFTPPDEMKLIFADDFTIAGDLVAVLAGDYNGNGTVDAADYSVWRDRLGQDIGLPNETVTLGRVTPEDYDEWAAHFGWAAGGGSIDEATIPEPATLWVCCVALLVTGALVKRR